MIPNARATCKTKGHVQTDCAQIWYTVRDRLVGCRAQVIGGTPAQFRTCKAHYLARSVGRPKRRYTGDTVDRSIDLLFGMFYSGYAFMRVARLTLQYGVYVYAILGRDMMCCCRSNNVITQVFYSRYALFMRFARLTLPCVRVRCA